MGCLTVILIIFAIFAFAVYAIGILIGIDIITFILFVASMGNYFNAKELRPSDMRCPNCGATDVKISSVTSGTSTNTTMFKHARDSTTKIERKRVARCQNCGFDWDYLTPGDIAQIQSNANGRMIALGIIFALCISLTFWIFSDGGSSKDGDSDTGTSYSESIESNDASIWLNGFTDITDFEYYLDGNEIHIQKYKGDAEKVRLSAVYIIDGSDRHVVSFSEATFLFADTKSVIIPEGTRSNSSDLQFLYLPSSLGYIDDSFWGYLHDMKKIYYGGTEEQWNTICTVNRGEIEVEEIVFNVNPGDLL